ncbi:MAG: DUF131 domain-containing protein, partial [Candidatus Bathyarchaeia archaeon]
MSSLAPSSAGGQGFGLIMIGPIPIILGTGSGIPWRALSAIALILSLAFLIYALMRGRRGIGA